MTRKTISRPATLYQEILRAPISPSLRAAGFVRAGQTYFTSQGGNWGLISFQRSSRSTSHEILFTVNLGVASARLLSFEGFDPGKRPPVQRCHWQERIGFLMPEARDRWWSLNEESDAAALANELMAALTTCGAPAVCRVIRDEDLRDMWLAGRSPGLTDIQRLKYLCVLLKALGPASELASTIGTLEELSRGTPAAVMVRNHIDRLRKTDTP